MGDKLNHFSFIYITTEIASRYNSLIAAFCFVKRWCLIFSSSLFLSISTCPTKHKLCISEFSSSSFHCFYQHFYSNEPCPKLYERLENVNEFLHWKSLSWHVEPSDIAKTAKQRRRRSKYDSLQVVWLYRELFCRNRRDCSLVNTQACVCVELKLESYASFITTCNLCLEC